MFEEANSFIKNYYGKWFQVYDYKNPITIEFFPYVTGIFFPFNLIHCTKCIAVNQCYFIDEEGKKPDIDPFQKEAGLYHPNCHCMERNIKTPSAEDIKLIIPNGKFDWLIKDKLHLINVMGYNTQDFKEFYEILLSYIIDSYVKGEYSIKTIDRYGVKITINLKVKGNGNKNNHYYNLQSSWMVFPNGKLKCNTLIGGMI